MIKKIIPWILVVIVVVAGIWAVVRYANKPGPLDGFATCLANSGAKFYGAFWCPHCRNEKALFGKSVNLLPYVECSTPDGQGQTQVCIDKKITGYPTWIFADGSQLTGEIPLKDLADKTSCTLPQQ